MIQTITSISIYKPKPGRVGPLRPSPSINQSLDVRTITTIFIYKPKPSGKVKKRFNTKRAGM